MHGNIGYKIGEGRHITKNMVAFFQKQSVDQIQTADGAIAEGDVFIIQFGIILPVMDHAVFDCKGMGIRTQHFELQFMESLFCRGGIRYNICTFGAVDIIGSGACAFYGVTYFGMGFDDAVDFQFNKIIPPSKTIRLFSLSYITCFHDSTTKGVCQRRGKVYIPEERRRNFLRISERKTVSLQKT